MFALYKFTHCLLYIVRCENKLNEQMYTISKETQE